VRRGARVSRGCRLAIFLRMFALVLAGLLLAGGVGYLALRHVVLEKSGDMLANVASSRVAMIRALGGTWRNQAALIASHERVRALVEDVASGLATADQEREIARILEDVFVAVPHAVRVRILGAQGRVIVSTDRFDADLGLVNPPSLARARGGGRIVGFLPLATGDAALVVASPVSREGVFLGAVELALTVADIVDLATDYTGLGETGEVMVARRLPDGAGRLLAPARHRADFADLTVRTHETPRSPMTLALGGVRLEAMAGASAHVPLVDYRGERVLAVTRLLEDEGLAVVAKLDRDEAMAPLHRLTLRLFLPLVAGLAGASYRISGTLARRLVRSEERIAAIVGMAADGIVWLDGDQRVLALNPAAETLLHTSADAVLGTPFHQLPRLVEKRAVAVLLRRLDAAEGGAQPVWRGDLHVATGDGGHRDLAVAASVRRLPEGAFATLILRDVTERNARRRQLQRALALEHESLEQQRAFVATVSHEFRTPLAVIDGIAQQMLRRDVPRERARAKLEQIRRTVARLTELMESVVQSARRETPGPGSPTSRLALATLLAESVEEQRRLAPDRRIVLITTSAAIWIEADATAIRHLVGNLLTNALKYSSTDRPVFVTLMKHATEATIAVLDRGIGIPAAERDHLFERFYRATNVGAIPGTGIGLHVARELAAIHGGRLDVASEEGLGSIFTVALPLVTAPTGVMAASTPAAGAADAARAGDPLPAAEAFASAQARDAQPA